MTRDLIASKIHFLRGERVLIDFDLASLYSVETKHLKRQVRRNIDRFPSDFMFQLNAQEYENLRSQIGALKQGRHAKYLPYAFTEHGVTMIGSWSGPAVPIHSKDRSGTEADLWSYLIVDWLSTGERSTTSAPTRYKLHGYISLRHTIANLCPSNPEGCGEKV